MLQAGIQKQQLLIDDFKTRLKALTESEHLSNDAELDGTQSAQKAQMEAEINLLNDQLQFANEEMILLQGLQARTDTPCHQITLGAVVVTDSNTFFVSASLEAFQLNGETFIGISTHSPLYKTMMGKKKGESFNFQGTTYSIKDVF